MARGKADFDGAALRVLRRDRRVAGRRISAEDLARMVGTSKARILAYENSTSVPEPGRIAELARVLEVHPEELCSSDSGYYAIRDMRYHVGLTAAELAGALGIGTVAYRHLEREALLPVRDDGTLLLHLARALNQPLRRVQLALEQHPVAAARRSQITDRLTDLFGTARTEHVPAVVDPQDPHIAQIADILRRPPGVVSRLINHELSRYRQMLTEQGIRKVEAAYAQSAEAAQRAKGLDRRITVAIETAPASAAGEINRFLAEAMSSRQWRLLVQLYNSGPAKTKARESRRGDSEGGGDWAALEQRGFVDVQDPATRTVSARGVREIQVQHARYACLYPRTPAPRHRYRPARPAAW